MINELGCGEMRLFLKLCFKNITIKPFRTLVIVLCLAAVSLTFSLCLTISSASKAAVEDMIRNSMGRTDITIQAARGFETLPELPADCESLPVILASSYFQVHDINNYKYVQKRSVYVIGVDTERAAKFGFLPKCTAPSENEAVISYALSQRFGYDIGDEITLPCADGTEIILAVSEIVLNKNDLSVMTLAVITAPETARTVLASPGTSATIIYIDAPDGKESETAEQLCAAYTDFHVDQVTSTPESRDSIRSVTMAFLIIFAVTLLMILFIISAFSKNIAVERLAVIGTLRSIGAEKGSASLTLLTECAVYGMIGGIIGTVIFYALKDTFLGKMIPRLDGIGGSVSVPPYVPVFGLVIPAVISCAVSFASLIRTSKMPVKDIIFGGKDNVYQPSVSGAVTGIICIFVAVILFMGSFGFIPSLVGLAAFVTGICLVLPKILSAVSKITAKHTYGGRFPVMRLALIQSGTKKTAVMGTVICTAVVMMTASLYILSRSAEGLYSVRNFNCDALITNLSERSEYYDIISADSKEFIYTAAETTELNGRQTSVSIFGYHRSEMFKGLRDLPESLGNDEIALDRQMMKRLDIHEGDSVTLTLKHDTIRPVTLTFTAVKGIDSVYLDQKCNAAVINLDTYKSVYHDYPSMLLVRGDTELMHRQLIDKSAEFETADEYYARMGEGSESITGLLDALAVIGILLAVISVSGQQMIGFEQRKHELAVLRSQGMSISQLSKMLLCETLLTAVLPVLLYLCTGRFVILIIEHTLSSLDMQIPISYEHLGIAEFIAIMAAAVILTVLIPIFSLKRMNTAEQLKCE
ncbi:ABC transporter permease [Ruminococcus albus]|nr:ABC transporter permease [Ruminococcus albus]